MTRSPKIVELAKELGGKTLTRELIRTK